MRWSQAGASAQAALNRGEVATAGKATITAADQAAIHNYALALKSAATRRAYRSDFAAFTTWCAGRTLNPIPAAPETVAAFIADQANAGLRASNLIAGWQPSLMPNALRSRAAHQQQSCSRRARRRLQEDRHQASPEDPCHGRTDHVMLTSLPDTSPVNAIVRYWRLALPERSADPK